MQGNFKVEISIKGTFHRSFFDKCEISHVCKSNTTALIEEQNSKKVYLPQYEKFPESAAFEIKQRTPQDFNKLGQSRPTAGKA